MAVRRARQSSTTVQNYASEEDARDVLRQMGMGENAIDYYLLTLLPCLSANEQLMFPPMDIPARRLGPLGFKVARISYARQ
ncbi:MAG: hypothetical protein JO159_05045 [Acidobacteria bacterium]|nr:hypothetical protein [Acidobacteriota bacterium]